MLTGPHQGFWVSGFVASACVIGFGSRAQECGWLAETSPGVSHLYNGTGSGFGSQAFALNGRVYVTGLFDNAGGIEASQIIEWTAEGFAPFPVEFNGRVWAVLEFDDGTGVQTYIGGSFTEANGEAANRVIRWDGVAFEQVGEGFIGGNVAALAVFDDGDGTHLYAAGNFETSGSNQLGGLAKWSGTEWLPVGMGVAGADPSVNHLIVFDDGTGASLVAAGDFNEIDGIAANNIAMYRNGAWSSLGQGTSDQIRDIVILHNSQHSALFVAGEFTHAGGLPANYVARWDGALWHPLGDGLGDRATSLAIDDDEKSILVAGDFQEAGGVEARSFARWNGRDWTTLADNEEVVSVSDIFVTGGVVHILGSFSQIDGIHTFGFARLETGRWIPASNGFNDRVWTSHHVAAGPLAGTYAGGQFDVFGSQLASGIAKRTPGGWEPVGEGFAVTDSVVAIAHTTGEGADRLYAAGSLTRSGATPVSNVAQWDGAAWSALGEGLNDTVWSLEVFDDGSGLSLYAGGAFQGSGATPISRIAKWDGSTWSEVGGGAGGTVRALRRYDDGTGEALYVGGDFTSIGSVQAQHIAKWNGKVWEAMGGGTDGRVWDIEVYDDGSGPGIYICGEFDNAGTERCEGIARWDGASWQPVGAPFDIANIYGMAVCERGSGPALIVVGGMLTSAGAIHRIAEWNGAEWTDFSGGFDDNALTVTWVADEGLYVGGEFLLADGATAAFVTLYRPCATSLALTDLDVIFGTIIDGAVDDLLESDDHHVEVRSQFGFSALEPNIVEVVLGADGGALVPPTADLSVAIESRLNNPGGTATLRLRNWKTNALEQVHSYSLQQVDALEKVSGIDATNRVRPSDGRVELAIRHSVIATFAASGFESSLDLIEVTAN